MSFFNSSKQSNRVVLAVPPEIMARISVMNDHMVDTNISLSDTDESLHAAPPSIPLGATMVPHGPFSAEDPSLVGGPTVSVQPVSQESVDSSPFLQTLAPEALLISEKVKPQVESPMFLTDKQQSTGFGFSQTPNFPQVPAFNQAESNAVSGNSGLIFRDTDTNQEPSSQKTWWMLGVFLIFLFGSLGGAYYYFYFYSGKSQSTSAGVNHQSAPIAGTETSNPDFDFSLTSPNYLSVNVETISTEEFRSQLEAISAKMKLAHIGTPVEFLITDQTNTPVAFSRFVALFGLKISQNIVSMTEENFSLYLVLDKDKSRVALRVSLKDGNAVPEVLKKSEADFPLVFQNIFLESKIIVQKKYSFKESVYNGLKIRYVNLSEPELLSLDYVVQGTNWYIGTSKESMRTLLDAQKK